jgi:hypothetical protein
MELDEMIEEMQKAEEIRKIWMDMIIDKIKELTDGNDKSGS